MSQFPVKELFLGDPLYPKLLKEIPDPPLKLYYRGTLKPELFHLAFVGSRKMTEYGIRSVDKIIAGLMGGPVGIVSGLAFGIDGQAHRCALNNKLYTLAVLGSPLDSRSIYPRQHRTLAHEILQNGGAIISEYQTGCPVLPRNFSLRNRIISGMSKGTVVIEAQIKSGALITSNYALNQNRDVFAVPGSIFSDYSEGTNSLIKRGAKLVTSAADILDEFPEFSQPQLDKAE